MIEHLAGPAAVELLEGTPSCRLPASGTEAVAPARETLNCVVTGLSGRNTASAPSATETLNDVTRINSGYWEATGARLTSLNSGWLLPGQQFTESIPAAP